MGTGLLEATTENPLDPIDWKTNFYQAFDALGLKSRDLIRRGTENSMKQHAALLRQVCVCVYLYVCICMNMHEYVCTHSAVIMRACMYMYVYTQSSVWAYDI